MLQFCTLHWLAAEVNAANRAHILDQRAFVPVSIHLMPKGHHETCSALQDDIGDLSHMQTVAQSYNKCMVVPEKACNCYS